MTLGTTFGLNPQSTLLLVAMFSGLISACGSMAALRDRPPALVLGPVVSLIEPQIRIHEGVTLSHRMGRGDGLAEIVLFLDAGARDDRPNTSGLMHILPELALLGIASDSGQDRSPHEEALRIGWTLEGFAGAGALGWRAFGPEAGTLEALAIVRSILEEPTFPPSPIEAAARRWALWQGATPPSVPENLAVGLVLGGGGSIHPAGAPQTLRHIQRDSATRAFKRVVGPRPITIAIDATVDPSSLVAACGLFSPRPHGTPTQSGGCRPAEQGWNFIAAPLSQGARVNLRIAIEAPPASGPVARARLMVLVHTALARLQAAGPKFVIHSDLKDLDGRASVLLLAFDGEALVALEGLERTLGALSQILSQPPSPKEEQRARARWLYQRTITAPIVPLWARAEPATAVPSDAQLLAPWATVVVVRGPAELERRLSDRAPLTVWDATAARVIRGPTPPCTGQLSP